MGQLLTIVSKLNQDVDRIGIGIYSQLAETVAMPVRLSFWHIVGLFSGVSRGIIHMQYVMRRMRDRIDSDWLRVAPLATVARSWSSLMLSHGLSRTFPTGHPRFHLSMAQSGKRHRSAHCLRADPRAKLSSSLNRKGARGQQVVAHCCPVPTIVGNPVA